MQAKTTGVGGFQEGCSGRWGTEWKGSSVCTFQRQKLNMPYTKKQEVAIEGYYFTILEFITKHTVQFKEEGERSAGN